MAAYEALQVSAQDGVLEVVLDRPEVMNALNRPLKRELRQALQQAGRDDSVRVVLLRAEGRGFSAGQDLRATKDEESDLGVELREYYNPLILAMRRLGKPIVAAVQGIAAGAGMSIALAADLRLLGESAQMVCVFSRIGLVPDSGMSYMLPRLVGLGRAMELAMLAEPVSAPRALELGLANRVFPDSELLEGARSLCRTLAEGPAGALRLTKLAFQRGLESDVETALEYEAQLQSLAARSKEYSEGVSAFLERRKADFRGIG